VRKYEYISAGITNVNSFSCSLIYNYIKAVHSKINKRLIVEIVCKGLGIILSSLQKHNSCKLGLYSVKADRFVTTGHLPSVNDDSQVPLCQTYHF
jgi:hypothetical protein